ncbi:MAG: M17 family metallopeptidase [Marinifilaceae bacterium]
MRIVLKKNQNIPTEGAIVYLVKEKDLDQLALAQNERAYLDERLENKERQIVINRFPNWIYVEVLDDKKKGCQMHEALRKSAHNFHKTIHANRHKEVNVVDLIGDGDATLAFMEGLALTNYQFLKYFKEVDTKKHVLESIHVFSDNISERDLSDLTAVVQGVYYARDLVNEPVSYLNAVQLGEEIKNLGAEAGFKVEVFGKSKIQALKMGGLLAVNKGSIDPPTFSVMEWAPEDAVNEQPLVLVGKGIVYDTGGLSLKPTKDSMDQMKSDMGGAAAVIGAIYAAAKAKLPVHVIGLIPSTDNRPDGNAYAPGDVITMYNGLNVEVLNTDAEGRMILADALSYASKFKPGFVMDLATLTGAAAVAIGKFGVVAMGNSDAEKRMELLKQCGQKVYERIVEFPFWEEYGELIKSDIADIKNLGGRDGGAITAGKFLEHFTDYPWVHLDIAGPAFVTAMDNYRGKGGTGVGVRLLFDFIKQYKA